MALSPSAEEDERFYVIVGTGFVHPEGEEMQSKGRIIVYEVKHINIRRDGDMITLPKLVVVHSKVSNTYMYLISCQTHALIFTELTFCMSSNVYANMFSTNFLPCL
jgi:hypothetical protein